MPSIVEYLSGFTNQGNMHDYAHASRLYLDDTFALAPKTSWIYYVVFSINPAAISEVQWNEQKRGYEAGMLVKAVDLPKFKIQVETLNQYNRKTLIQQKISYEPISMTFHDDMSNVTNSLWVNYFRYYYRDTWWGQTVKTNSQFGTGDKTKSNYGNTKYQTGPSLKDPTGRPGGAGKFGLNNNQSVPFFNAVTIYQLNAKRFTSYVLVNPLFESWEHDQLDQSSGNKFAQSRCTLGYETVFYGEGRVSRDQPSGFATFHYDLTPSPLSIAGGGNSSIFGPGGILSGTQDLFGQTDKLLSGNSISSLGSIASIGIQGSNLIRNYKNISDASLKAEGQSILNSAIKGAIAGGGPGSGLLGGIIGGGLGSLGKSLGFGPQTGTLLNGVNFQPNQVQAASSEDFGLQPGKSFYEGTPAALKANDLVLSGADFDQLDTPTALKNALDEQNTKEAELLTKIQEATAKQVEVDAAVNKAIAADGAAAGIAVREQYAAQGYIAPSQYGAQLQAITDNKYAIQENITASEALQSKLSGTERTSLGNAQQILTNEQEAIQARLDPNQTLTINADGSRTIKTIEVTNGITKIIETTSRPVVKSTLDSVPLYQDGVDQKPQYKLGPPTAINN